MRELRSSNSQNGVGTGAHYPPLNPSWHFRTTTCVMIGGIVTPGIWSFMNLFNRTLISGKANIYKMKPPYILASNHLTLLDDLFIGPLIFFPKIIQGYQYVPYHVPEERNFYKKKFIAWFMKQVKSVPLVRGQGLHQKGMNRLIEVVKAGGIVHIYPEGTRTRNGDIGDAKPGIGRIVREANVPVIPMYHQGLEKVLPIGSGIPRIAKEIRISIGEPLTFEQYASQPSELKTWQSIANEIVDAIKVQRQKSYELWGEKPVMIKHAKRELDLREIVPMKKRTVKEYTN